MPTFDEELRDRIGRAAPAVTSGGDPIETIARRKHRRAVARKVGTIATVAAVLLCTIGVFALLEDRSQHTPQPADTSSEPTVEGLGLPFPTCRVSSMPISTDGSTAYVFTDASGGCPKRGDETVAVGIDVTGDGSLDAIWGPIPDCWFRCQAFAAPDVNGDGVSEVAVSTEGADGYGVSLYAVTTSPPAIAPITVSSTFDRGPAEGKPLQFAWVDVATHASSANCAVVGGAGPSFALYSTEKLTPAQVQTTSLLISGSTATVTDISTDTMPFDQAPMPGTEMCGAPIYGSAAGLGASAVPASTRSLCDVTSMTGDIDGDGGDDLVSIGTKVAPNDHCPSEGTRLLEIDLGGDGSTDVRTDAIDCTTWCFPFALADLNDDGTAEILVNEGHLAPPISATIGVYEFFEGALQPILFPDGSNQFPLQNSWQGYLGAYCTNPSTFWLWEGPTDPGGTLRSTVATAYELDVASLSLNETGVQANRSGIPDESGYGGKFCGADIEPLG